MIGNRSIIEKADLAVADLTTDGGALETATARQFIRTLIDESTVMPLATVVAMRSHTHELPKARFAERVLRAGTEGQALGLADRAKPELSKVTLQAQLFKAEIRLTNEVLEDSIEQGSLRQTILTLLSERIALDMDEVTVQGDTTSVDPFLAKFDGLIKQVSVNTVNAGNNPLSKTVMKDMLKAMPSEFARNRKKMRYLVSINSEIDYRDSVSQRETGMGDRYHETDMPIVYNGTPILDVPVFPENLGSGNETVAILTDPKNLHVGIWRKITIESDKDISAGALVVVASIRFDARLVEARAAVKGTDITVS